MVRYLALLVALLVGAWIAFTDAQVPEPRPVSTPANAFSADRAFADVTLFASRPHPIGSPANARVRDALVARMTALGLSPQVRPGVGVLQRPEYPDMVIAGPVENVIGVLPGRDRTKSALAIMSHYDSVPGSPGAADDIMGVAASLEAVRAIKSRGTPARDVMLIVTDGEEAGLLGANHFFQRDPLARRVGLILNLEARGSAGRVNMFQTSKQNGELIDLFQRTAVRPASSSLSVMIYEKMPNDTDMTESLAAGVPGMNYAIIGRQFDYHSPTSTPANLERGSLQDMGTQLLAAAGDVAIAPELPGKAASPIYSNLFGDVLIAYPHWVAWALLVVIAGLLAFAVRWARQSGGFSAFDILRGMGAVAFAALGAVAALQFARRLTGAAFGFIEQRFLLAQVAPWEWAIILISLGFLMLAAGELARGRRWMAAIPLLLGLGCSAFGELDLIGAVTGVLAGVIGVFVYSRRTSRQGGWAGVLVLGLILAVVVQAAFPDASYVLTWPLLVGAIGAATTALGARQGLLSILLLAALAAAALGWAGGMAHFTFEAMDLMPLFAMPVLMAGFVLWPLAQPDDGAQKGAAAGLVLLGVGLALTVFVRSNEPWSARFPQASYVGYLVDQDTGKAWRFSPRVDETAWSEQVLGGKGSRLSHWSWRQPQRAAAAPFVTEPSPQVALSKQADGSARLSVTAPGARTLALQVRSSVAGQATSLGGVPLKLPLPAGKWIKVAWQAPGVELVIRPSGPGRLDVRYSAAIERWPQGVAPLPPRPATVMAWDNSDSTFVTGTRAFTW